MKTVITSTGDSVESIFDKRFGRAAWYCVYDEETGATGFHQNPNAETGHGAGTKAVEMMMELGIKKIISGDFGPKAKELLDRFNIQMVIMHDDDSSVKQIIDKIK